MFLWKAHTRSPAQQIQLCWVLLVGKKTSRDTSRLALLPFSQQQVSKRRLGRGSLCTVVYSPVPPQAAQWWAQQLGKLSPAELGSALLLQATDPHRRELRRGRKSAQLFSLSSRKDSRFGMLGKHIFKQKWFPCCNIVLDVVYSINSFISLI